MVESGFLVITAYDRQIEYLRFYGDTAIMAGSEVVVWGEECRMQAKPSISALQVYG